MNQKTLSTLLHAAAFFALAAPIFGCASVKWRDLSYQEALAEAQREDRRVFVYFRSWSSVDCTKFEDGVLTQSAVINAVNQTIPVRFDYTGDRPLADAFAVKELPTIVVVTAQDELISRRAGTISADDVLSALSAAPPSNPARANRPEPGQP